jgi:hypothetical protein
MVRNRSPRPGGAALTRLVNPPATRRRQTLFWLKLIWASPNTLLGLLLGVTGVPFGTRARLGDNALNFFEHPLLSLTKARAITFGHCVLYHRGAHPDHESLRYDGGGWQRIGDHERAHTLQYELWGPFFLPAYLFLALLPRPHPLECQADRWAARDRSSLGRGEVENQDVLRL